MAKKEIYDGTYLPITIDVEIGLEIRQKKNDGSEHNISISDSGRKNLLDYLMVQFPDPCIKNLQDEVAYYKGKLDAIKESLSFINDED